MLPAPAVSVVICTRNRGAAVLDTARSILEGSADDVECLIVDQSDTRAVAEALGRLQADPRLRYIGTATRGLSAGRNVGLHLARGPLVAMTDDDCLVDPAWAASIQRAFAVDPRIALVFGNVLQAPFDATRGFIPAYRRRAPFLATTLANKADVEGMGACMAVRREAVIALGGFDERLGAGSSLHAGEDVDLTLRMLAAGHAVFETPDVRVTHRRFASWGEAARLVRGYWTGAGAAIGLHLWRRPGHGLRLLGQLAGRFVAGRSRVANSLGPRGMAGARLGAFLRGLAAGVTLNVRSRVPAVPFGEPTGANHQPPS